MVLVLFPTEEQIFVALVDGAVLCIRDQIGDGNLHSHGATVGCGSRDRARLHVGLGRIWIDDVGVISG